MTEILTVTASIFSLLAVRAYFIQLNRGESTPNPATWLIWIVVIIINTVTYFSVVNQNIWLTLSSIVLTLAFSLIFIFAIFKGKFTRVGRVEVISIILAVAIGIYWQTTNDAILANLALQIIFLISFYPTVIGLLKRDLKEKPMPWIFGSFSYLFSIIAVSLNIDTVSWVALGFPVINLIGNGGVALIVWKLR
jgi:hypothetical protein